MKFVGNNFCVREHLPYQDSISFRHINNSVDPHKSIHAMKDVAGGLSRIFNFTPLTIYHNKTHIHLLTSDNPIVYLDASAPEKEMQPYSLSNLQNVEFIFPITSNLVLHGHPSYSAQDHFSYKTINNADRVRRYNRLICKFAYERVFSSTKTHEPLIIKHADKSPVLNINSYQTEKGTLVVSKHEFGIRTKLPKWDEKSALQKMKADKEDSPGRVSQK